MSRGTVRHCRVGQEVQGVQLVLAVTDHLEEATVVHFPHRSKVERDMVIVSRYRSVRRE